MKRTDRAEHPTTFHAVRPVPGGRGGESPAFELRQPCDQCIRVRASLLAGVADSHHTHGMGTS